MITVDEFSQNLIADLENFNKFWLKKHKEDPENYPSTMVSCDWEEQFCLFQQHELS